MSTNLLPQRPTVATPNRNALATQRILASVSEFYGVTIDDLKGPSRRTSVALARHVAMYLIRCNTTCILPDIGAAIGFRDHTTVLHGVRRIGDAIELDEKLKAEVAYLQKQFNESTKQQVAMNEGGTL